MNRKTLGVIYCPYLGISLTCYCSVYGEILSLETFPNRIWNLNYLMYFSLSVTNINGTLTESMLNMRQIKLLYVQKNNLERKMSLLLVMVLLTHIEIGENNFAGTISPKIG